MDDEETTTRAGASQHWASESARERRLEYQTRWVDIQVQRAIERGEFDDLPGAGKPIEHLSTTHDPDWWLKRLIEREHITGVLPAALALRVEDARLDDMLDDESSERHVREVVDDFNARIVAARRQLQGGPPVITATRDPEIEVDRWRRRRALRREVARRARADRPRSPDRPSRRWWRRLSP